MKKNNFAVMNIKLTYGSADTLIIAMKGKNINLDLAKNSMKKRFVFICLIFVSIFSYSQKQTNFYGEIGFGLQFFKTKITNSKFVTLKNNPSPKIFLGLGLNYKLKKNWGINFDLNLNPSIIKTELKYTQESKNMSYSSELRQKAFNYGFALGLSREIEIKNKKIVLNSGLKFQKVSVQALLWHYNEVVDSILFQENFTSNNFNKNETSLGYYLNGGYSLDKKRKWELVLELNGTLNKPYYGSNELYYNNQLIEKVNYKRNIFFLEFKIRRRY